MITAVDTSVILDVLTGDPAFAEPSESALRRARAEGKLIVCECVIAEIYPALDDRDRLGRLLGDWQLELTPIDLKGAVLAGEYFSAYLKRGGAARRVIPDFLIGAHASVAADRLLARDRGYLRDYFTSLVVWDPGAA